MVITQAGLPAGYGYFTVASVADVDIMPDVITHLKTYDPTAKVFAITTMKIEVGADCGVSINGRAPVHIKANSYAIIETRGIKTLSFDTAGVNYNLTFSY